MKATAFALLLLCALPASASLIAYDFEAEIWPNDADPGVRVDVTGTVVFDTALLGVKRFVVNIGGENRVWHSDTAVPLEMVAATSYSTYIRTAGTNFDKSPDNYYVYLVWEAYMPEPVSLYTVLNNFDAYWAAETSPDIGTPEFEGSLDFSSVGPAYSVPEPATLSLLALGLAAIGIRRRLRAISPC